MPLISCIVPVWNGERYLAETLDSILAQTHRPLDVIVVDDGSTDGTADVVRRYGQDVTYVYQAQGGSPSARNRGLSVARGDHVAFLDADDLWHPHKLASQLACLVARPELDGSVTLIENFWSPDVGPEDRWFRDDRRPMVVPGYSPSTLLARASTFERVGWWDTSRRHAANAEWFIRARAHGAVIELLPEPLVRRRLHAANTTRVQTGHSHEEHLRLVKAVVDRRRSGGATPGGHSKPAG